MPIKDKARLIVGEGLFGNTSGNSASPQAFETLGGDGGKHPSSVLYFSRDPVALDCVMYDDLLDEAKAKGSPKSGYAYGYLKKAADSAHAIGTYELSVAQSEGCTPPSTPKTGVSVEEFKQVLSEADLE